MGLFAKIDAFVNKIARNPPLWTLGLLIILGLVGVKAFALLFPRLPQPPVYASYQVLQPEWNNKQRERYYQASQGSLVMPYKWYRALESRTSRDLFASTEVQSRYGLLPDNDPVYNPDRLPVGIVKDKVEDRYVNLLGEGIQEWASISCAACHTGQLLYKGTALRIDGGQAFWGFEQWSGDLVFSLMLTSTSPSRFDRFCARVNGLSEDAKCTPAAKDSLRKQLKTYFNSDLIIGGLNEDIHHTYLSKEGFGRTAALGRGVNGEFAPLNYRNVNQNSGPVSYPPLWYTHDFDWVQSSTAIRQPLGRNVTEAWGVSVRVQLKDPNNDKLPAKPAPDGPLFASSARIENMYWIELLLSNLKAPKWPEAILGPIDRERAERGKHLYNDVVWEKALPADQIELKADPNAKVKGPNPNRTKTGLCARCHAPAFDTANSYGKAYLQLPLYDMEKMGTDRFDAEQFAVREVYPGPMKGLFGNKEPVGIGVALTVMIPGIIDRWFEDHPADKPCRNIMEGYRENAFRAPKAYPARPLDGYWATGPFLHNGSVRTIYELLSPVEERATKFYVGTREFDPKYLGFRNDAIEGAFVFNTKLAGNSNRGHEFRDAAAGTNGVIGPLLTPEQRLDIVEYLKVIDSVQIPQDQRDQRAATLNAMAPFYEDYSDPKAFGTPGVAAATKGSGFCEAILNAAKTAPSPEAATPGTPADSAYNGASK